MAESAENSWGAWMATAHVRATARAVRAALSQCRKTWRASGILVVRVAAAVSGSVLGENVESCSRTNSSTCWTAEA